MKKSLFFASLMAFLWMSSASGQSILQKSDWQEPKFETFLPPPAPAVPWLDLNRKTKLPKGDLPIGRDSGSAAQFVLPSAGADKQMSSNALSTFRSM